MDECLLCSAERVTPWLFEDEVCWIAECLVCRTPMVVWRAHGLPDEELEAMLLERLGAVARDRYGEDGVLDRRERRRIPTTGTRTRARRAGSSTRERPLRQVRVERSAGSGSEAGEDLRLLRLELRVRQHPGVLELTELLGGARACRPGPVAVAPPAPGLRYWSAAAWSCQRLACRRETRLDTAVAVPATTAVLPTARSRPGISLPFLRSVRLGLRCLESSRAAMIAFTGIAPLPHELCSPAKGGRERRRPRVLVDEEGGRTAGLDRVAGLLAVVLAQQTRRGTLEDRELRVPSAAKSCRSSPTIVPSISFFTNARSRTRIRPRSTRFTRYGNASPLGCLSAGHSTTV